VNVQSSVFLQSIVTHLGEVFQYFNIIRKTLQRSNDSTLKKEYLLSEKSRFDQMLTAMLEHEGILKIVLPVISAPELSGYLHECMVLIQNIKGWAGSTEVYLLRSGKASLIRNPGKKKNFLMSFGCKTQS